MIPKMYVKEGGIPYMNSSFVTYPKEGGTLCYIENCEVPRKIQLDIFPVLYSLDLLKRTVRLFLKSVGKNPILLFFAFIGWKGLLKGFIELCEVSLRRHNIVLDRFCDSAREMIRAVDFLTTKAGKEINTKKGERFIFNKIGFYHDLLEIVMVIIFFFEYDMAYRHRTQFAFSLINKDSFCLNPFKEMKRVMAEMNKREHDEGVRGKYKILDRLLWLLKIPIIKKLTIRFIKEADLTKISPDESDKWWMINCNQGEFDFKTIS